MDRVEGEGEAGNGGKCIVCRTSNKVFECNGCGEGVCKSSDCSTPIVTKSDREVLGEDVPPQLVLCLNCVYARSGNSDSTSASYACTQCYGIFVTDEKGFSANKGLCGKCFKSVPEVHEGDDDGDGDRVDDDDDDDEDDADGCSGCSMANLTDEHLCSTCRLKKICEDCSAKISEDGIFCSTACQINFRLLTYLAIHVVCSTVTVSVNCYYYLVLIPR